MFIGHYGIAFALKKYAPKTSLGFLFIAVQLADIAFFTLLLLGIEHARIIPGFTEASPLDLYDFPISHSLLGSLAWTVATYLVVRLIPLKNSNNAPYRQRTALILSVGVFSHFVLDVLVHTPDLLLVPGLDIRIGLGLWNSIIATVAVELAILVIGCCIYLRSSPSGVGPAGKYGIYAFLAVLLVIIVITPFMTFPDTLAVAIQGILVYAVLTLTAWWLDSKRHAALGQV
ncbi:MAG: hypothetical protein AM326_03265 [Candidatus Thorarchaeota archaeon SMTZ-45]|nr:MAG: hypothetical protein AM326_03265 [Candidatus Thorarchaeota archaeon SMTZ-45]